jgi:Metal-independent alpha-mannosidase (GH125)
MLRHEQHDCRRLCRHCLERRIGPLIQPCAVLLAGDKMEGLGSTHTPPGHVWPLAMMVEGLTSASAEMRIALLRQLLQLQVRPGACPVSHPDILMPSNCPPKHATLRTARPSVPKCQV